MKLVDAARSSGHRRRIITAIEAFGLGTGGGKSHRVIHHDDIFVVAPPLHAVAPLAEAIEIEYIHGPFAHAEFWATRGKWDFVRLR